MGTRADFYVGRGETAEWLGSIAWDGYPSGQPKDYHIADADTEDGFREYVALMLHVLEDGTTPGMGWPWPWDDSCTTDYAYAFDSDTVWCSYFGSDWFDPKDSEHEPEGKGATFPDMSKRKNVDLGKRSGLIILRG